MDIEFYGLRIFCQVIGDKTFSKAAHSLRITQPSVSQQIAKLEKELQGRLFERVGHDLIPTQLAHELHNFALPILESLDDFGEQLANRRALPKGSVRYAMPESCQWTPHYRQMMNRIRELPDLQVKIEILPNDRIVQGIIEGKLDFGFVIGDRIAPELRFEKFCEESYSAVAAAKEFFLPLQNVKELFKLRLVTFPGWETPFEIWAKAHGFWAQFKKSGPESALHVGTLAGAIHAIQEGAGVGVIPTHCVANELKKGSLKDWRSSKAGTVSTQAYMARRVGDKLPKRVEVVMEMLRQARMRDG